MLSPENTARKRSVSDTARRTMHGLQLGSNIGGMALGSVLTGIGYRLSPDCLRGAMLAIWAVQVVLYHLSVRVSARSSVNHPLIVSMIVGRHLPLVGPRSSPNLGRRHRPSGYTTPDTRSTSNGVVWVFLLGKGQILVDLGAQSSACMGRTTSRPWVRLEWYHSHRRGYIVSPPLSPMGGEKDKFNS